MKIKKAKIGVIGYGRFGKLLCGYLLQNLEVHVFSRQRPEDDIDKRVIWENSMEILADATDFIIPAVPISQFKSVVTCLSPHLRKGVTIMDVCSVKMYPVEVMLKNIPTGINIIASHPMFGQKTLEERNGNLQNLKMVMWKVKCDPHIYYQAKKYFQSLGLDIVELSPQQHDEYTATSQSIAQTLRFMFQDLNIKPTPVDTEAAAGIFKAISLMGSDRRIWEDMQKYNPYVNPVLQKLQEWLEERLKSNRR